jgi:hypothetical protein
MLPPADYAATLRRLLSELNAGRLEPEVRMAGAPPLSELVRVEKIASEVGLERALRECQIEPAAWAEALRRWGPALNSVEVHARRQYWMSKLDVSAEVQAILDAPTRR